MKTKKHRSGHKLESEKPILTDPVDFIQGFAAPLDQITFPDASMPTEILLEPLEDREEDQEV